MTLVKSQSFKDLQNLTGKLVKFMSSCEMFPQFNVTGNVTNVSIGKNNEIIFDVITKPNNKNIKIGSNMRRLSYEIIK